MENIGITTTVPVEIIFAAGYKPIDLNNVFITSKSSSLYIENAEKSGFPRTTCSWIKGIYSACMKLQIKKVIAVIQGDCSNTHALSEILQTNGIEIIPFAYPYDKDEKTLNHEILKLIDNLGTTWEAVMDVKKNLDINVRRKLNLIDSYTWKDNLVHGEENHYYLVNSSDFNGNYIKFEDKIDDFIKEIKKRDKILKKIRIGYIGVPSVFTDLYEYIESLGGHIVFNEIQRQFSMPYNTSNMIEQYLLYTYPYSIFVRIEDIREAINSRKIDGIINYVQTFCFRHMEDIILRKRLNIPLLTIEGDKPGNLDARTKIRLETFMEMLKQNKH
ncbi:2-hydroxyacyl-CoA dehydratase [Candidatus Desantisbacteria bacterium]|nr:2-hydroxyacyl-CoA dehydratase [Candidatus Desantisbacteria bacterium]